jgi:hypothetical protein
VVAPGIGGGALDRPEIGDVLDDAEEAGVALAVAADRAGIAGVEIATDAARLDGVGRGRQRRREGLQQALALLEEMQRGAARRARPQPGQLGEELDEALDLGQPAAPVRTAASAPAAD